MRAEIISIGTELLLGHILNADAAYLAKKLAETGIDLYHVTTVGDNPGRLAESLRKALGRSDVVITTGGLGPTVDDITIETIGNALGLKLTTAKKGAGVKWIRNSVGTAPGLIVEHHGKTIICMPGPLRELQPMFAANIIPHLKKSFKALWAIESRMIKTTGIAEAQVNIKVRDLLKLPPPTTVGIYAKLGEVDLNIVGKAGTDREARKAIKKIEKVIVARLGRRVFGFDDETLEGAVAKILTKRKKTIAVAESCTGGLVSSCLTDVSGSSRYFTLAIVSYSNESKENMLGVSKALIQKHGAVSKQVALEMAKGVRFLASADIGIGLTGIAGPTGGTRAKPVGLVHIALVTEKKRIVREFRFKGSRAEIKFQASQSALDMIRCNI